MTCQHPRERLAYNDDGHLGCNACGRLWRGRVCAQHRTPTPCLTCEADDLADRQAITHFPEWEDGNGTEGVLP